MTITTPQDFVALSARVEETKTCVNKTSTAARNFLQPNAAARLEDMFNETVTGGLVERVAGGQPFFWLGRIFFVNGPCP